MDELKKCFFCERFIIPSNLRTTRDINDFFKKQNMEFTLNYCISNIKIGKKDICTSCEKNLCDLVTNQCNSMYNDIDNND